MTRVFGYVAASDGQAARQGLLALTFDDPADYDKIGELDPISIVGLKEIQPGKPLTLKVKQADGNELALKVNHTFTEEQLTWFRAGSALNSLN